MPLVKEEVTGEIREFTNNPVHQEDINRLFLALGYSRESWKFSNVIGLYIIDQPHYFAKLLANEHHACQMKRARALLRLNKSNQFEYVDPDSKHHASCIDQAMSSKSVSQLAKVLAEYELKSKSAEQNSPEVITGSRVACKLFIISGSSVEAEVFRQLVVEKINDGDITTALKLCCIGHQNQILFCREIMKDNFPISDVQTLRAILEQMLTIESNEQEASTLLSICDEWYRVLEPQGLMNIEERERTFAGMDDRQDSMPIQMIRPCHLSSRHVQCGKKKKMNLNEMEGGSWNWKRQNKG